MFRSFYRELDCCGFSIIEVLVAILIFFIFVGIAAPQYREMSDSFSRAQAVSQLEFQLRRARSEAIAEGSRYIFTFFNDGRGYTIGPDYFPFNDPPSADEIIFTDQMPEGINLLASESPLVFDTHGFIIDEFGDLNSATISLFCRGANYGTAALSPAGEISFSQVEGA